jgi:UDP-N-acetylmuramoyl-tripeptide--D-alanyl-D-alanine ligase
MPSFSPASLAAWTGGCWSAQPALPLGGFTQDTRQLREGQVFVALKTEKRDGHDYLAAAAAAGASAALVNRVNPDIALPQLVVTDTLTAFQTIAREHRRAFRGPVIGVTGSSGKTSTKNLLALLLGGSSRVLATEGNLNNYIGVPLTLTRLEPDAHATAVIEAGISCPGEMDTLAGMIEPDYGVVTMIGPAHTQELGGLEGVAKEKSSLLRHLRPEGLGVFPLSCWEYAEFQDLPEESLVVVPEGRGAVTPRTVTLDVEFTADRTELVLGGTRRFSFRRVSRGMAENAGLAIALASELGASDVAIQRALAEWRPAKWRGEFKRVEGRLWYLDFYNANPASMADALQTFAEVTPAEEPRCYVLGGMEELGAQAAQYHRELGRSLKLRAQDRAFVIGALADEVVRGAVETGTPEARIEIVTTLEPVAERLAGYRGAVFVKGSRSHALERAVPANVLEDVPAETRDAKQNGAHAFSFSTPDSSDDRSFIPGRPRAFPFV